MATATAVCSLENYLVLPDHTMDERIAAAREALGRECVVLGHHYQRDEVIRFADYRGDSYKLAQQAAHAGGKYIVFCGVHFMAESADILSRPGQVTVLPDLNAGCSMADMAEITQVENCWEHLVAAGLTDDSGAGVTPDHLHEFHGCHQSILRRARRRGMHFVERGRRFQVGLCRRLPNCFFFPISISAAIPDTTSAFRSTKWSFGIPTC